MQGSTVGRCTFSASSICACIHTPTPAVFAATVLLAVADNTLLPIVLIAAVLLAIADDTPLPVVLVAAVLLSPADVPLAVAIIVRSGVEVADPFLPLYVLLLG